MGDSGILKSQTGASSDTTERSIHRTLVELDDIKNQFYATLAALPIDKNGELLGGISGLNDTYKKIDGLETQYNTKLEGIKPVIQTINNRIAEAETLLNNQMNTLATVSKSDVSNLYAKQIDAYRTQLNAYKTKLENAMSIYGGLSQEAAIKYRQLKDIPGAVGRSYLNVPIDGVKDVANKFINQPNSITGDEALFLETITKAYINDNNVASVIDVSKWKSGDKFDTNKLVALNTFLQDRKHAEAISSNQLKVSEFIELLQDDKPLLGSSSGDVKQKLKLLRDLDYDKSLIQTAKNLKNITQSADDNDIVQAVKYQQSLQTALSSTQKKSAQSTPQSNESDVHSDLLIKIMTAKQDNSISDNVKNLVIAQSVRDIIEDHKLSSRAILQDALNEYDKAIQTAATEDDKRAAKLKLALTVYQIGNEFEARVKSLQSIAGGDNTPLNDWTNFLMYYGIDDTNGKNALENIGDNFNKLKNFVNKFQLAKQIADNKFISPLFYVHSNVTSIRANAVAELCNQMANRVESLPSNYSADLAETFKQLSRGASLAKTIAEETDERSVGNPNLTQRIIKNICNFFDIPTKSFVSQPSESIVSELTESQRVSGLARARSAGVGALVGTVGGLAVGGPIGGGVGALAGSAIESGFNELLYSLGITDDFDVSKVAKDPRVMGIMDKIVFDGLIELPTSQIVAGSTLSSFIASDVSKKLVSALTGKELNDLDTNIVSKVEQRIQPLIDTSISRIMKTIRARVSTEDIKKIGGQRFNLEKPLDVSNKVNLLNIVKDDTLKQNILKIINDNYNSAVKGLTQHEAFGAPMPAFDPEKVRLIEQAIEDLPSDQADTIASGYYLALESPNNISTEKILEKAKHIVARKYNRTVDDLFGDINETLKSALSDAQILKLSTQEAESAKQLIENLGTMNEQNMGIKPDLLMALKSTLAISGVAARISSAQESLRIEEPSGIQSGGNIPQLQGKNVPLPSLPPPPLSPSSK